MACYEAKDLPSKSILSQLKRRFYPILKTLELNAEKATFWRINHFLQPISQANGQPALERQAVAIEHNLATYFSLDALNRPQRHESEQISRILLNYLPS